MKRIAIVLAILLPVLASCGDPIDRCGRLRGRPELVSSPIASASADEYFNLFNTPILACVAAEERADYMDAFFEGFREPGVIETEPRRGAARRAGGDYRKNNPDKVATTFASFGYTEVVVVGVWRPGFVDDTTFTPDAPPFKAVTSSSSDGELWVPRILPEARAGLIDAKLLSAGDAGDVHVRLHGYVSATGRFGTLRRVYVSKIEVLDVA
jgi:hypothetical protein